ncbi:hypothetical protein [Sedimenticola hydrogenitrophicus]|uniref:hypothetical protein n=1 Tax=Sedimenticola hydrogenitrophicus TaxID=2967975 RepID=UPI0021A92DB9|nr:hypothetical protein [Sedimenticola hydrogenitrophicus]
MEIADTRAVSCRSVPPPGGQVRHGDEFDISKVRAFDWAELVGKCGLERRLMAREIRRMTKALGKVLPDLQAWSGYTDVERSVIGKIAAFTLEQADRLEGVAGELPHMSMD